LVYIVIFFLIRGLFVVVLNVKRASKKPLKDYEEFAGYGWLKSTNSCFCHFGGKKAVHSFRLTSGGKNVTAAFHRVLGLMPTQKLDDLCRLVVKGDC